jgi:hypothetical protein
MRARTRIVVAITAGIIVTGGCGDAFGPDDAVGRWELSQMNGAAVPGTVTVKWDAGAQSDRVAIQRGTLIFAAGGTCRWEVELVGEDAFSTDDCTYGVDADEVVAVLIADLEMAGPASGSRMTLTDEDTNLLVFQKQ